jgi:sialate O-acetylesterase
MKSRLLLPALVALLTVSLPAAMPKEDVIEIPAIGDGLCVSNVFQSNMVLQRDKPVRVWGWASPGESVTVTFGGNSGTTTAADDRTWKLALPAMPANATPQRMTVKGAGNSLTLDNILVGDVWVLGGQSNMEFELAKVENGPLEIVSANFPEIRILTVPYAGGLEPRQSFPRLHEWSGWFGRHFRKGDWDVCTPEIARDLSAIGYVFARRVHMATRVPIGVIDASRGGTTVEAWTPLPVLRSLDSEPVKSKLAEWDEKVREWDPRKDLEDRIARHRSDVERMTKEGKPIPADKKEPTDLLPGPIADHNHPGACHAGMIGPLIGLSVKGAIFHQGYNNAFEGMPGVRMYREVFPAMIQSWRESFNDPAMPFGILSLCTDGYPQTLDNYVEYMFNTGIYIRAVHYSTFLDLHKAGDKNIGYASTYDLRRRWFHPQLKLPAGERIARWALATQYGFNREIQWQPPMLTSMEKQDGALLLKLDQEVGDPEDGAILGFAIAGADRRFQPATATHAEAGKDDRGRAQFDRKQLVLTSPLVADPIHFRYAWGRNPLANLQATGNKDIPFATQRSDDWDMLEVPLGVLGDEKPDPKSRAHQNRILQALRLEDTRRRLDEATRFIEKNPQK